MTASSNTWIPKLRAVSAAVALFFCSASASAALALQSPDVCSMSCCVQEGHCCCTPHHAYVKGQGPDGREQVALASLSSSCPGGCTTSQSISRNSFKDSVAHAGYSLSLVKPITGTVAFSQSVRSPGGDLARDPRGPPFSSLRAFQV